ncbi:MAG: hypothetical protein J6R37_02780 [Clostridia bacterium]|nr:hypothetical protein [Clostridia bacterium]
MIIILVGCLSGCAYKGYSGDYLDLYTVAINSVLWLNGYSWGADYLCDAQIEIIEEDSFGRKMFTYYELYYGGSNISFSALIICQYSNENEVFYYEDVNYVVKEQELYIQDIKDFEEEEIEKLKKANDWNKELAFEKCIKKEIENFKPAIPYEEEIINEITNEFQLKHGEYNLFLDFLTRDSNGSNFIIYGYVRFRDERDIAFIGLVQEDEEGIKEINYLCPLNVFDYKAEFVEFKERNNWK